LSPNGLFRRSVNYQSKCIHRLRVQKEHHLRQVKWQFSRTSWCIMHHLDQITLLITSIVVTGTRDIRNYARILWNTHSKLANPELRLFSLSKKSVTISLKGIVHVKITRDELVDESRWRWSKSSARWEKHRSIMSPRYSSEVIYQYDREIDIWNLPSGTIMEAFTMGSRISLTLEAESVTSGKSVGLLIVTILLSL
jgi:hypothetical protein